MLRNSKCRLTEAAIFQLRLSNSVKLRGQFMCRKDRRPTLFCQETHRPIWVIKARIIHSGLTPSLFLLFDQLNEDLRKYVKTDVQPSTELVVGRRIWFLKNICENWRCIMKPLFRELRDAYRRIRRMPKVAGGTVAKAEHINWKVKPTT